MTTRISCISRVSALLVCGIASLMVTVGAAQGQARDAAAAHAKRAPKRVGGRVHRAWPRQGAAPKGTLPRWLARQVGPTRALPCRHRVHGRLVACRRPKARRSAPLPGSVSAAISRQAVTGTASAPGVVAADRATDVASAAAASTTTAAGNLSLMRSFDIPTDDPSYVRLLNWSWTYDSAMSAAAFVTAGDPGEAEQMLDQLTALQHTDGSIEIAFDVASGSAESVFRSGTIAAVGLAASLYDQLRSSSRYLAMEERAAGYLLSLQGTDGLIRGGPDVRWYSTQHNLLAYAFLGLLAHELTTDGHSSAAAPFTAADDAIAAGIDGQLLVRSGNSAHFIEGLGDDVQTLDSDALGIMCLRSRGETSVAQEVLSYTLGAFGVSGRSITHSSAAATYNMTYAAKGPFQGFRPYLGAGAPDVLWTEGSAEMLLAQENAGTATTALAQSLSAVGAVTPGEAPLQADRTVTSTAYGAEYHVWPAAAAGAWEILAGARASLF